MARRKTKTEVAMAGALRLLGDDRVLSNVELAAELDLSAGVVRTACLRLVDQGRLRYSKVRSPRRCWRFALTGEVVTGSNYPKIRALRSAIGKTIPKPVTGRPAMAPKAMAAVVHKQLHALERRRPAWKSFLARCRRRFHEKLQLARSRSQVMELLGMVPFHARRLNWWPIAIERRYEERIGGVFESLDRAAFARLDTRILRRWARDGRRVLAAADDPSLARKIAVGARNDYHDLLELAEPTGLLEQFVELHPQFKEILALETLPSEERLMAPERLLQSAIDRAHDTPADQLDFGQALVREWPPEKIAEALQRNLDRAMAAANPSPEEHKQSFLRRAALNWRELQAANRIWAVNMRDADRHDGEIVSYGGPPIGQLLGVFSSVRVAAELGSRALAEAVR